MRHPDWKSRLNDFIESRRNDAFAWGSNDCVQFASRAAELITARAFNVYALRYKTARGAALALRKFTGCGDWLCAISSLPSMFNLIETSPALAGRGDVVLVSSAGIDRQSHALAIVSLDARFAVAPGPQGLAMIEREAWVRAWRVA